MKKVFRSALTTLLFSASLYVYAQGPGGPGMTGPGMMNWGYGMGWFGWIFMIIFSIVVIAGVVILVRWMAFFGEKRRRPESQETAIDILKKRYAKGEITKEEYEKIKKDIS